MAETAPPEGLGRMEGGTVRLPEIKRDIPKNQSEVLAMRGVNYSDQTQPGDLAESRNLSARRYPYLATRRGREQRKKNATDYYAGVTALTAWGKLVAVEGTNLLLDGQVVGTVTAGEKQFAVVNTKMVIWPDKVYLDMKTQTVKPLAASLSGSGAVFTASTMKVTGWGDLTEKFSAGDGITISGCATEPGNNRDVTIQAISADTITVSADTFQAAEEASTAITLERKVPEMDYICESENRLWGCSSAAQVIYASSLGDPTNFNVFEGLSTDSYALAVGTEGSFTGCCKLASSILFWKETKLHKILGGYPAEYSLYTYDIEGLQAGCHKSLQVINETLYYLGLHGVYAYSGGTPSLVSAAFGERQFSEAVAGSDGESYYLSAKEGGKHHLLAYEARSGIWVREDDTEAVDFARIGKDLYFLDAAGSVWLADNGKDDGDLPWMAQFTPFYETSQGRKTYSKLLLRVELPRGSWLVAEARYDGGVWRECGKVVGRDYDAVPLRLAMNRCDKFEVRLRGKGPCALLSLRREFSLGSDVR